MRSRRGSLSSGPSRVRWIGLDLGTTHLKAVVYDDGLRALVATVTCPTPVRELDGSALRDAEDVAVAAFGLIVQAADAAGDVSNVAGLAIASVGEEIVLVDAIGRPTGPTLAWYNRRGRQEAADFKARYPTDLHRRFPPDPSFSLFKLLWLQQARPGELARCSRLLDLSGYVLSRLGAPATMDWSHASRTGFFDPVAVRWDAETLEAAGLKSAWCPPLAPSGHVVGHIDPPLAHRLGLPAATALVTGGHDHFCGAFGSGVRGAGELYLSAGTSEALLVLTDRPVDLQVDGFVFDQGRFVDEGHWYVHVAVPSGHAFRQWSGLLYPAADEATIEREVASASAAEQGVLYEPGTVSAGSTLRGLPFTAGRATVMRAVVEGSAVASARIAAALVRATGLRGERMIVAGHAVPGPLWRELRGGMTGRTLEIVDAAETSALGAALVAQRGVTGAADIDVVARTTWQPTASDLARGKALRATYDRAGVFPTTVPGGDGR